MIKNLLSKVNAMKNCNKIRISSAWVSIFFLALPAIAMAQNITQPPEEPVKLTRTPATNASKPFAPLPAVPFLSSNIVPLTEKEAYGLKLADEWKNHPDRPRRGGDGSVVYLYGATMPVLICTPLEVCSIRLQPGEIVNDVHTGDIARWRINPATSGSGGSTTTFVVVKPTDSGLTTDLFITTTRRSYTIKLVSDQQRWIPILSFDYPDDIQAAWASYHQREGEAQQASAANYARNTMPETGQNLANLDFRFRLSGDNPSWIPLRVYTDGLKTYIQFPRAGFPNGAPALVALGEGGWFHSAPTKLVNYRVSGDRYVVDQVLHRAALITGVDGDQQRVIITYEGN
ncbi:Conjugal transfer protein TrbG [Granulibacter bethesdensis CGDNIH4]|nr:Conjugal transfer protein TrbG [Granulibacter bethesdensis CGDNIH4]